MMGTEKDCSVAVIIRDGRILVGLRHYTPEKWKAISVWTLPGGRCDIGETLEANLRREVEEEIGIRDLRITAFVGTVPGALDGDIVRLFAAETDQDPKNLEPEKFETWEWKDPEDMPENFINPAALAAIKAYLARPSPPA